MKIKKCIICEQKITNIELVEKYEVHFCSEKCVKLYEEKIEKLGTIINWDKCC
ncbi:hypothetical protein HZB94_02745 [Candidatus Falkowbacteria bacterium]|nr:hypothetical protein [Candidatus Falkowbacteria bacterium]